MSRNFVCILRTTTTRHMVRFIDFYFYFLPYFQNLTSPHMFSIFTHVMKPVGDINSEPGLPVFQDANLDATVRCRTYYSHVSIHPSTFDIDESKKLVVRNKGRNLLVYLGKVGKGFLRLYWGEGGGGTNLKICGTSWKLPLP